jgi:hypothetical protein
MKLASVALFVVSTCCLLGCGGPGSGTTLDAPGGANEAIVEVRDMILDSSVMGTSLKKPEDAVNFEGKFPKGAAAVKDKTIVIVWGVGFKEGIAPENAKLVAYEAKTPNDGGWIVKDNGEIYQVTAADFAPLAPKPTKK